MSLQKQRDELSNETLKNVTSLLEEIIQIRSPKNEFNLDFDFQIQHYSFNFQLKVKGGTVTNGSKVITDYYQEGEMTTHELMDFPIIFLHQVAFLALKLKQKASCIAAQYIKYNMDAINQLIAG